MYLFFFVIEDKLYIVDKSKQKRSETRPDVLSAILFYPGSLESVDDLDQSPPGGLDGVLINQRCYKTVFVDFHGRDTVGSFRTGGKNVLFHADFSGVC